MGQCIIMHIAHNFQFMLSVYALGFLALFSFFARNWQVNFAPGYVVGSRGKKGQEQKTKESQPIYTHSLDK